MSEHVAIVGAGERVVQKSTQFGLGDIESFGQGRDHGRNAPKGEGLIKGRSAREIWLPEASSKHSSRFDAV